jgi:Protein of unknown function (DUF3499)
VDPAPACSRLGCDESAVAVFAFDARECLVWLDPISTQGRGAGVLCERHADRMSPPRGWNLLDRRGAEFRMWTGSGAAAAPPTTPRATRRERTPRRAGTEPVRSRPRAQPGPLLPFDAPPAPVPVQVPAPEPVVSAVATAPDAPRSWSPHARPGPEFEHVLDARTPMLARAFDSARPADDA